MTRRFLIPLALGTLILGTGLVGAQGFGLGGFGARQGAGAQARGPVTIAIYAQDPDSGAEPFETLTLNRPLSPAEIIANYQDATFVVMTGDSFSRTIELAALAVEVSLYADDPAAGGEPLVTATLPDMSGLDELIVETEGATFAVVSGEDFTRTIDLSRAEAGRQRLHDRQGPGRDGGRQNLRGPRGVGPGLGPNAQHEPQGFGPNAQRRLQRAAPGAFREPGFGLRGFGPLGQLEAGDSVTVTFFQGDPADGGSVVETLTFTAGEDDRVVFQTAMHAAAAEATHLQVGEDGQIVELGQGFGPRGFRNN